MKKVVSLVMVGLMLFSGVVAFADTTENVEVVPTVISVDAVPTLYDLDQSSPFEVAIDGNEFMIILNENPTTGYAWSYELSDESKVEFVKDDYTSSGGNLIGAGGSREFTFTVKEEGVSTISFEYSRPWEEDSAIEAVEVLVYKSGDKLFVEENQIVYATETNAQDIAKPELYTSSMIEVYYNDETVDFDVSAQVIDGVTMIPLSATLIEMGYEVKWVAETRSVEISKGAQWTSIRIDENAYFKNKVAARPLSSAPVIVEGRTLVPAEFFTVILDRAFQIENGNLKFIDDMMAIHSGYVKDIAYDETGTKTITIVPDLASNEMYEQTVIHTSSAYTYYNKEAVVGEFVNVICPPIMTMSIPAQTSGYIVY